MNKTRTNMFDDLDAGAANAETSIGVAAAHTQAGRRRYSGHLIMFSCAMRRDDRRRERVWKTALFPNKENSIFSDFLSSRDHFAGVFRAVSTLRVNVIAKIIFLSRTRMKIRTFE